MWMLLTPREVEIVMRPAHGDGTNAILLRQVQTQVDRATGDLELDEAQVAKVRLAKQNWQGGHTPAFKVLLDGLARHAGDRPDGAA